MLRCPSLQPKSIIYCHLGVKSFLGDDSSITYKGNRTGPGLNSFYNQSQRERETLERKDYDKSGELLIKFVVKQF